jgi:hypothetical protein
MKKKFSHIKNNYLIEAIILIIIGAILVNTLFINPIIGKYDNGDFARLMIYGGLSNVPNNGSDIFVLHTQYLISSPSILLPFYFDWVSGSILLKIAVVACLYAHNFNNYIFDIRYLAFVYSLVFLLGIFLILRYKKLSPLLKCVAGIFIILFFTDTSYVSYFNSLYGEPGTIVFFFLTIGTYLTLITKDKPKIRYFVFFFIASAGFLTSKAQELPLLVFMILVYLGLFVYYKEKKYRKCIVIGSLLVTMLCAVAYFSLTDTINENNIYQAVFNGVLRGSKNPQKDLEELGLNKNLVDFYGKTFYNRQSGPDPLGKEMLKEFYPNISSGKVLAFYIKHPDRLWQKIQDSADNAYGFLLPGKWSFAKGQYDAKKPVNTFRTRLILKSPKLYHNIYIFIAFSLIYFLVVIFYFIKCKDKSVRMLMLMLLFILAAGSSQLILPVIGSGHGDFPKHLFLLNLSYDIMFGITIVWFGHVVEVMFFKILCKLNSNSNKFPRGFFS